MPQLLLLPDPRPLVDRLGHEFFRQLPECAGVYLMRDASDAVLYVGKAKNLRKRLGSYRVANPDRMRRRQLRLLRAVERIEIQECSSEAAALAKEAALLRSIRPRFNRAGTWPGPARYLGWRCSELGIQITVTETRRENWAFHGPLGSSAFSLRATLLRLLWCAIHFEEGIRSLPHGWFEGHIPEIALISRSSAEPTLLKAASQSLDGLFGGDPEPFVAWIRAQTSLQKHPFEEKATEADLEALLKFAGYTQSTVHGQLRRQSAAGAEVALEGLEDAHFD